MKLFRGILFICGIFLVGAIQTLAQSPCEERSLPKEQLMVHLNRNVCLAGETIWFKAWCFLDGQLEQELSKVLYLEVFDENQKVIVREKYLIKDNRAAGSIRIPEDVPSKYYFLKAYTRYMRNFSSEDYHYQQITIVNPYLEGGGIATKVDDADKTPENASTQRSVSTVAVNRIQIELDKERYLARERINFHLESLRPLTAELSASVRWQGLGNRPRPEVMLQNKWLRASCNQDPYCRQFYVGQAPSNSHEEEKAHPADVEHLQWRPETRGLTISGVIQDEGNEIRSGALAMVAALQEEPMLYFGNTDEQGTFTISLHHMQQQKNLFVGTPNEKSKVLVRNDFDSKYPEINAVPLQYDSILHQILESLHLHQQLNRAYPQNKTKHVFQPKPLSITSTNIVAPDRRIVLSDFISVPTMTEVFRDLATGVSLQESKGKKYLSVFNFDQQKYYDSPLTLLDNVPIYDISKLLEIDPAKVEAIEIYDSNYILGDYTIGGIISIITKTDDFAGYEWEEQVAFTTFQAFAIPQAFEQVVNPEQSHYPNYRPVLYWNPEIQLTQQQASNTLSIYAPDRPGMYEVLVQGYTDAGEACWGHVEFEVVGG